MVSAFLKKWWVESDFKAPILPLSLRLKVSGCHYNSIYNNTWTKQIKQLSYYIYAMCWDKNVNILFCNIVISSLFLISHSFVHKISWFDDSSVNHKNVHNKKSIYNILVINISFNIFSKSRSRPSWSSSYGSWIYNHLCNQSPSPPKLWIRTPFMARCTQYNIMWKSLSVTCHRLVVFSGYSSFLHQ